MKHFFKYTAVLAILAITVVSCKKDFTRERVA